MVVLITTRTIEERSDRLLMARHPRARARLHRRATTRILARLYIEVARAMRMPGRYSRRLTMALR
jgi:hypothetical protein